MGLGIAVAVGMCPLLFLIFFNDRIEAVPWKASINGTLSMDG